jgi:hypothetical protein
MNAKTVRRIVVLVLWEEGGYLTVQVSRDRRGQEEAANGGYATDHGVEYWSGGKGEKESAREGGKIRVEEMQGFVGNR